MKFTRIGGLSLAITFGAMSVIAQSRDTAEAHVAVAKAAAGQEHMGLFDSVCTPSTGPRPSPAQGPPPRSEWHAVPAKVFDNLYFVGQTEYSAWAVTTSDGIIVVDALWDYSVEDEVVNGLRKLGLDPAKIKYVLLSHGHIDHAGRRAIPAGTLWSSRDHIGGRLGLAGSRHRSLAEAQTRYGRHRWREADARRYNVDTLPDTWAYARHDFNADSCERRGKAACRRRVGWHRVQLAPIAGSIHHAREIQQILVRNLQQLRATFPGDRIQSCRGRVDIQPHDLRWFRDEVACVSQAKAR